MRDCTQTRAQSLVRESSKILNHTDCHAARAPAASPGGDAGSAGGAAGAFAANTDPLLVTDALLTRYRRVTDALPTRYRGLNNRSLAQHQYNIGNFMDEYRSQQQ